MGRSKVPNWGSSPPLEDRYKPHMFDLNTALRRVIETDGSDLHLKVPSRPLIRRLGQLEPIPDTDPLTPEDTEQLLKELPADENKRHEFDEENEVDFSFSVPGL